MGASSSVYDRFRAWARAGVFERRWRAGLLVYDTQVGIAWEWQAMDGAMTKAPLGGKGTGPNPTDRRKCGVKRSLLTEGRGIPLAAAVDGANRLDIKLVAPTLQAMVMERPPPTAAQPQHLCLDKGYDDDDVRALVTAWGDTAHIQTRGETTASKERIPGYRARRWVVERTHS